MKDVFSRFSLPFITSWRHSRNFVICMASFAVAIAIACFFYVWGSHIFSPEINEIIVILSNVVIVLSGIVLVVAVIIKLDELHKIAEQKDIMSEELKAKAAAIEACMDGILIVNPDGNLTYMNHALMNLHNVNIEEYSEYIGQSWKKIYGKEGNVVIENVVLPEIGYTGYWKGEIPVSRVGDKTIYAETAITFLSDGGMIGSERDITVYRKTELEREDLQKQFFQSQKMEAVGRLAGGIAHDFNNILSSITGYTEFLLEDLDEDSKQHHFAWQIMQGGMQAKKLIEQILTFSRHRASDKYVMDVVSAVKQTVGMLRSTLPTTIVLDARMEVDRALIDGNISQVTQNIMNLCINAMDAMEDGHGVMEICVSIFNSSDFKYQEMITGKVSELSEAPLTRLFNDDNDATILQIGSILKNREYVCLSVSDTGTGMSRELMERIFDPFFTTKPVEKGTGLGLASIHGVMGGHGGAIVVDSTVGKGTGFFLYFPLTESVQSSVSSDKEEAEIVHKGSGCILIVDDQDNVRRMMTEMLERIGYETSVCESGHEAIDYLRAFPGKINLVLTDHIMPHMTGTELAEEIDMDFPGLPVVIISGYSKSKLEEEIGRISSIKSVLSKPLDGYMLSRALKQALGADIDRDDDDDDLEQLSG